MLCIGYRSEPLEGVESEGGIYRNKDGRVAPRLWAVGWCKRGPTGAIAANRKESQAVAEALLAELAEKRDGERDGKRDDAASASGERDGTASAKLGDGGHDPRPRKNPARRGWTPSSPSATFTPSRGATGCG